MRLRAGGYEVEFLSGKEYSCSFFPEKILTKIESKIFHG